VYGQKSFPDEDISSIPLGNFAGVVGAAVSWPGVFGWSTSWHGVEGVTYSGEAGVLGRSEQGSGVVGQSGLPGPPIPNPNLPEIAGMFGTSDTQAGVIGTSNRTAGVLGFSNNVGVYGVGANYAGIFIGNLLATGTKSAAVPFPDGTQRMLYCMESPELWFEDFGTAKLKGGRAVVRLDADFANVIKRGDYKVFFTPEGDCRGLSCPTQKCRKFRGARTHGRQVERFVFLSYRRTAQGHCAKAL
jgi:hypothetical protein